LAPAFVSLSWPFLIEVLRQYGFSEKFLGWLAILLVVAMLWLLALRLVVSVLLAACCTAWLFMC
jgi:hypothetical protein